MKLRGFWIFVLSLVSISTVACSNPFKVTDPADPKFKPENFRFEDYPGIPPMTEALRKLFPVGTDREFVEKVLIDAGGAKLKTILSAEQIDKNNKAAIKDFPEHAQQMIMPAKDLYIYTKFPDYLFPSFPKRVWNVGVQYDEGDKISLLKLNGTTISETRNNEGAK